MIKDYLKQFDGLRKFQLTTKYCVADLFTNEKEVIVATRHVQHLLGKTIEKVRSIHGEDSVREIREIK